MVLNITNEDCMDLMARYPDKYFDLAVIDPPYGILNLKWDKELKLETWIKAIYSKLKDDGTLICFGQQPMFSKVVQIMGNRFSHEIIWEKTQKGGFVNANRMPLRAHENIAISKVSKAVYYNPEKDFVTEKYRVRKQKKERYQGYSGVNKESSYTNNGTRFPISVKKISNWNGAIFGNNTNATIHPTQKPVELYKWLLKLYARPGAKILDCFLGSGSIAIACHDYNFDLTACELDTDYYNAAMKRINNHTAHLKLF